MYIVPLVIPNNASALGLTNLQFATNAQLQSDFDLNGKTEAHVLFGNRPYDEKYYRDMAGSSFAARDIRTAAAGNIDWKIAGKDGNGYIVLYNSDVILGSNYANTGGEPASGHRDSRFNDNSSDGNGYQTSDIKKTLDAISNDTSYFKTSEKSLMSDTTLTTKMKTTTSVTQKLYLAGADGQGSSYTEIYVGSSDNLVIPIGKWNAYHWLRSPSSSINDYALVASPSYSYVISAYVSNPYPAVCCALKINLNSVLFSSAASAASSSAQSISSGTFSTISGNPAMRLRTNGISNNPIFSVNGGAVTFNATSSQRLMVQVNDGTNNYQAYFDGNGSTQTVNLNDIAVNTGISNATAVSGKCWIEEDVADTNGRIMQSTEAQTINFSTVNNNENPGGYLQGINDELGDIQESWYIQPNSSFYSTIMSNYDSSYNSESTALQISTKEEFAAFGKAVNEGGKDFSGKYVKLMNDIDLQGSGVTFTNSSSGNFTVTIAKNGTPTNLWNPVGNDTTQFSGTFNGQGYCISNTITLQKLISGRTYAGVFGYASNANIKNVSIMGNSGGYCSSSSPKSGGIIGWMIGGQITNCSSNCCIYSNGSSGACGGGLVGTCSGGNIYDSFATGNVYVFGSGDEQIEAGGLVGRSDEGAITISRCYASGRVYGMYGDIYERASQVGGFLGVMYSVGSVVSDCYAKGDARGYSGNCANVGGFSGRLERCSVYNSYAVGDAYAYLYNFGKWARAGGFTGSMVGNVLTKNCYASGKNIYSSISSDGSNAGGFVGLSFGDSTVDNCYVSSSTTVTLRGSLEPCTLGTSTSLSNLQGTVTNTISGFNDDKVWYFKDGEYPKLMWQLSANVNLGDSQVNSDGSTYYMFPSATVTSDTSDLKIYSIIVSAMDKEYPNELKSGARIVSTGSGMTVDSNNTDNSQYYTSASGISLSQAQTFIRGLKFYCSEDFNAKVQLSYSPLPSDVYYYPGTGHYYKIANETKTWIDAYKSALNSNFRGMQGYLASITSEGEDNYILDVAPKKDMCMWLGGSRLEINNIDTTSASLTNTSLGYWYWASGPELLYNSNTKSYGEPNPQNSIFYNKVKASDTTTNGSMVYQYRRNFGTGNVPSNSDNREESLEEALNNSGWNDNYSLRENNYYAIEWGDRLYGNSETISCMASATKDVISNIDLNIITEAGRHLNEISNEMVYDDSCVINIGSDGVETVKIMSDDYIGGTLTHMLEAVDGYFIKNQKFSLVDYSNSTPQYYYYIVESNNLSQIPLTSFKLMEDRTTTWSEPSSGAVSDKLQFIVDFSDTDQSASRAAQNLKLSYKSDDLEISSGTVTINFGDSSFYGEISKSGQNIVMRARGIGDKNVYAVAKVIDSNGNQLSFSNKQSLSSNLGTFEKVRGGLAILKLGELSDTLTTYTMSDISMIGMPDMTYKVEISLCLIDGNNASYPLNGSVGSVMV